MGTVKLTLAVTPYMRAQKSGTIITMGSRSAWRAELPVRLLLRNELKDKELSSSSSHRASVHTQCLKLRFMVSVRGSEETTPIPSLFPFTKSHPIKKAFTENICAELAPFNIRTLIVQPGSFRTEGIYSHGWNSEHPITEYESLRTRTQARFASVPGNENGDPDKAAEVIVDIVRGEGIAKGREWPNYLMLGHDAEHALRTKCGIMLDALDKWGDVTRGVTFDSPDGEISSSST